jgi:outer membrane murein-binding lipoprotein Lpp
MSTKSRAAERASILDLGPSALATCCRWDQCPDRLHGDFQLLHEIAEATRPPSPSLNPASASSQPPLRQVPAEVIEEAVATTGELHPGWALAGCSDDDLHDRLEQHFEPLRREADELARQREQFAADHAASRQLQHRAIDDYHARRNRELWDAA